MKTPNHKKILNLFLIIALIALASVIAAYAAGSAVVGGTIIDTYGNEIDVVDEYSIYPAMEVTISKNNEVTTQRYVDDKAAYVGGTIIYPYGEEVDVVDSFKQYYHTMDLLINKNGESSYASDTWKNDPYCNDICDPCDGYCIPPEFLICEDIIVDNDPGDCGADITFKIAAEDEIWLKDEFGIIDPDSITCVRQSQQFSAEEVYEETFTLVFNVGTETIICTAVDIYGNSAVCEFTVTVEDTEPPVIIPPESITIECDQPILYGEPTITDNCDDDINVTYSETTTQDEDCPQEYTITRTWTAADDYENTATATQIIHIVDTTAPVFTYIPGEITIECDEPLPVDMATATDNCGAVTITYTDEITPGDCPQEHTITRTWKAEDDCGNTATATQIIQVVDTTAPEFTYVPEDITIEYGQPLPPLELPTAIDNCGEVSVILLYEEVIPTSLCPQGEYTIKRFFRATDECDNFVEVSQDIIVRDLTPPVTTAVLPPAPEGCNDWYDGSVTVTLQASDNVCGVKEINYKINNGDWITVSGSTETFTVSDEGVNTIDYYAVDLSEYTPGGNVEAVKSVEVKIDTSAPETSTLTITDPTGDWSTSGEISMSWTAVNDLPSPDNSGLDHYEVWREATADSPAGLDEPWTKQNGDFITTTFTDTGLYTDTQYCYKIRAYDCLGHYSESNMLCKKVDTENPGVNIINPTASQPFGTQSIYVEATYANTYTVNCQVQYDGETIWHDMDGDGAVNGTATYTLAGVPEGLRIITVDCWDEAGNHGQDTVQIIVDLTSPIGSLSGVPEACQNYDAVITLSCTDPENGVPAAASGCNADEDYYGLADTEAGCSATIPYTGAVTIDTYKWFCWKVTDNAGNIDTGASHILVDKVPPEVQLKVSASDSGTCIGEFTYNGVEYKTGSVVLGDGEMINAGYCLTLENLVTDVPSGVSYSTLEIFSSEGRLVETVTSPGPTDVDFAYIESLLYDTENCWVDIAAAGYDNCGNDRLITVKIILDEDGDEVCNKDDKCDDTIIPEAVPLIALNPNHHAVVDRSDIHGGTNVWKTNDGSAASPVILDSRYTMALTYGCSCEQILFGKPGGNIGEYNYGCSPGTMENWVNQRGWALDCQVDGKVTLAGEEKSILEDTNADATVDPIDVDNDGDGIVDVEDSEPDSAKDPTDPDPNKYGKGTPDWWCEKHPTKC